MRSEAELLGDHREAEVLRRLRGRDLMCYAIDLDGAGIGAVNAHKNFDERTFSGTILSAQSADLAFGNGKANVPQRSYSAEALRDTLSVQDMCARIHRICPESPHNYAGSERAGGRPLIDIGARDRFGWQTDGLWQKLA